jgi:hypothetical protein
MAKRSIGDEDTTSYKGMMKGEVCMMSGEEQATLCDV